MKKLTKTQQKMSLSGLFLSSFALTMLMGAGQPLHFSDIDTGVEEIMLHMIPENMEDNTYDLIVLQQGEPHFDEILHIVSQYDYQSTALSSMPSSGLSFSADEPYDGFSLSTYNGEKDQLTRVYVVESGALNVNNHRYDMENASLMVKEIYDYVNQYPEFQSEHQGLDG